MLMKLKRILIAIAILTTCFGCQTRNKTTAAELVGVWKTSAPKYEDRYLVITNNQMVFRSGEQDITVNTITNIEKVQQENYWILYTVDCENDENKKEQKQTISFYYSPDKGGIIKFKNQEGMEWKR
jgi:hypothetical protein